MNRVSAFGPKIAMRSSMIAGWTMAAQLWRGTRAFGEAAQMDARLRHRLPRIVLASLVMGAVIWAMRLGLGDMLETPSLRYLALAALVFGGIAAYGVAAVALGAIRPADLRAGFRRQR